VSWINALTPLQWALILAVPPAILSLYFLKLKRQPIEVPSTYLWSRTVEDLHVNSIWQRLRQSLLLLLQLLIVLLAILACLRPGWRGAELVGDRFIFLVDSSASMNATDTAPSRLEFAKQRVIDLIEQMKSGDVAMVISFSDSARIEQPFTGVRSQLRKKVQEIEPTSRRTNIREALRAAAGLANPGRTSEEGNVNDVQVADAMPATLYIFSDGGFPAVDDFSPGNLQPIYVQIGGENPDNVGIVSFSTERNPEKPGQTQAFVRIENCGAGEVRANVVLYLDDELLEAAQVDVPAADEDATGAAGVEFEFQDPGDAVMRLDVEYNDQLAVDNRAFSVVNTPRRANVLVVTPGNDALQFAMSTDAAQKTAAVRFATPDVLESAQHQNEALAGVFDLIVYDRCLPKEMPRANTFFIGNVPPVEGWQAGEASPLPVFIDVDPTHPLTQLVQMGDVKWNYDGFPIESPEGSTVLMDADLGPILVIGVRDGFEDLAMGLEIVGDYADGGDGPKTEWPVRRSFPVFVMNLLRYLGGARAGYSTTSIQPGSPTEIRSVLSVEQIRIRLPDGSSERLQREGQNSFIFTRTDDPGVYAVSEGSSTEITQRFAVNLFDARESDLRPRSTIGLGYERVEGQSAREPTRKEAWKWLLLGALVVLVFEWWVYNRRVYL